MKNIDRMKVISYTILSAVLVAIVATFLFVLPGQADEPHWRILPVPGPGETVEPIDPGFQQPVRMPVPAEPHPTDICQASVECPGGFVIWCRIEGWPCRYQVVAYQFASCSGYQPMMWPPGGGWWATNTVSCAR